MTPENQIPLPLDGFEFRAGFDAPTLVTISPERLALALASVRPAYRDAFVSALDAALGGDAVQRLREERDALKPGEVVVSKERLAILEECADELTDYVRSANPENWIDRARIAVNCYEALRALATTNKGGAENG